MIEMGYHFRKMLVYSKEVWFGLWCLTPHSYIFQLYCGRQFYWWRKSEYPGKTTDLSQVTDKHLIECFIESPPINGLRTHNFSDDRHLLHR